MTSTTTAKISLHSTYVARPADTPEVATTSVFRGSIDIDPHWRACHFCNEEYQARTPNQKFCSPKCSSTYHRLRSAHKYRTKAASIPMSERRHACHYCNRDFIPRSANHKYCTPECAKGAIDDSTVRTTRYLLLERDNFTCFYCGLNSYQNQKILRLDHVRPASKGGGDTAGNLVTACAECNAGKLNALITNPAPIFLEIQKRNRERGISDSLVIHFKGKIQLLESKRTT